MDKPKVGFNSIDEYIVTFPPDIQVILQSIRAAIRKAVPDATERISYQMPTFYQHGNIVCFAAWKNHIGLYPAPSGMNEFAEELAKYAGDKGSVRFPLSEPMPLELIGKIAQYRAAENTANATAKVKTRKKKA